MIMPATYAQLHGAMTAAAARVPDWTPATLLDIGSGPGTALWAATARWPTVRSLTAWEREPAFITAGRALAQNSNVAAVRGTRWERYDLRHPHTVRAGPYDLVVLGHVLNELSPDLRQTVVDAAWALTSGLLLIVEPGTVPGFDVVRAARDRLLGSGAQTLAPCAHDLPCPLVNDWCHFPQRVVRPDFQRRARGAPSEWEDSKYAYAAMARFEPSLPIWGRVIREPSSNKAYAEVKLSTRSGTGRYRAPKRQREAFRLVRDLVWGEALPEPPPEQVVLFDHDSLSEDSTEGVPTDE
jgi:ribosomal protein RSM22 (predicted rRNA methylase)